METEPAQPTIPEAADPKRPKVLSVSQPEQPKLSKPRILTQTQAAPQQPASPATAAPAAASPATTAQTSSDPKSEADWAEQTLSQAEKDAEEQRMANDIAQAVATPVTTSNPMAGKPPDDQKTPKTEPKSVPGLLYAIKGLADSISRKISGK